MNNAKVVNLIDKEVNIAELPSDAKKDLRKFYYEMPTEIRMGIALQIKEIFPEITPSVFIHMSRADVDVFFERVSELCKIFDDEFKKIRFSAPAGFAERLRLSVFMGSWDADHLLTGLKFITSVYSAHMVDAKRAPVVLQFMANYLKAWLQQKESGMMIYSRIFCSPEYTRLVQNPTPLYKIVDEYLRCDDTATETRIGLENLFYTILRTTPSEQGCDNIFSILDVMRAFKITTTITSEDAAYTEGTDVSNVTDSEVADNIGQVSIFGIHDFGSMPIDQVKADLIRLNRNTISEYLGGNTDDTGIAFDISDQVKMILKEELSPAMCAVTIRRGNEVDMATLLTHEGKTYLLFRRIGQDDITYGIAVGSMKNGARELIGISNESEFTYTLVGGEEIGMS